MVASQSRSSFCGVHRWRVLRVYAALFMQNCLRWSGRVSRLHSPAAARLTCIRLPPLCCAGARALVRRFAHGFIWRLRRASCACPAHPGPRHAARGICPGAVCPSAPTGLPQTRAEVTPPVGGSLLALHRWWATFLCVGTSVQSDTVQPGTKPLRFTSLSVARKSYDPAQPAGFFLLLGFRDCYETLNQVICWRGGRMASQRSHRANISSFEWRIKNGWQ